jgi:DNA-binding response OmpR family regulator
MKKRVLFVDNDPDFLDTRSESLAGTVFNLFKSTSFEQAEAILRDHWVHLVIIDLRLRDEGDERDTSGLTLAKMDAYRSLPKIILTKFPSYESVREALGPALDGLPPAVDFVAKQEGPEALLQSVEEAFARYVRINWDLLIRWDENLSFLHLTSLIEPTVSRIHISDRTDELEDLFRCLFYDSHQITISRLLTRQKTSVALAVFAFSEAGVESQFVVSCSQKPDLQPEANHDQTFAPKAAGQGSTVRVKSAETVHFAAAAYVLMGGTLEGVTTLTEFYRDSPVEIVIQALDRLFTTTLLPWYEKGRFREDKKPLIDFVVEWSGLDKSILSSVILEPRLESICQECLSAGLTQLDYSPHQLTLHLLDSTPDSYPNPITCLSETRLAFNAPLLCGTFHGQLNGDSILVDRQGWSWLIDFSQSGQGPLLRDFVSLETALKFELLTVFNVQTLHDMEKRLAAVANLGTEIDVAGFEAGAQKALKAIECIRHHAASVIGDDLDSYLGGLLYSAIGYLAAYDPTVRHTRQELIPYLHSLLSAAVLCQRLAPLPRADLSSQALDSLWVDEQNKEVWVEGREVSLSSQEFELLLYLYHHQGQLCNRTTIVEQVFGAAYEADMSELDRKRLEESRINSTMSRLRKKLEPNPNHPRYITSVRGEGYRLKLDSR